MRGSRGDCTGHADQVIVRLVDLFPGVLLGEPVLRVKAKLGIELQECDDGGLVLARSLDERGAVHDRDRSHDSGIAALLLPTVDPRGAIDGSALRRVAHPMGVSLHDDDLAYERKPEILDRALLRGDGLRVGRGDSERLALVFGDGRERQVGGDAGGGRKRHHEEPEGTRHEQRERAADHVGARRLRRIERDDAYRVRRMGT